MKLDTKEYEGKMKKSTAAYESELGTVRVGRANAAVLDKVLVDYYGTPTQINAMAQISIPEARIMVIQPWDASTLKPIEKAILASDLGAEPAERRKGAAHHVPDAYRGQAQGAFEAGRKDG